MLLLCSSADNVQRKRQRKERMGMRDTEREGSEPVRQRDKKTETKTDKRMGKYTVR